MKRIVSLLLVLAISYISHAQALTIPATLRFLNKPANTFIDTIKSLGYTQENMTVHGGDTGWVFIHFTPIENQYIQRKVILLTFANKQLENRISYMTSDSLETSNYSDWLKANNYTVFKTSNADIQKTFYINGKSRIVIAKTKIDELLTNYGFDLLPKHWQIN